MAIVCQAAATVTHKTSKIIAKKHHNFDNDPLGREKNQRSTIIIKGVAVLDPRADIKVFSSVSLLLLCHRHTLDKITPKSDEQNEDKKSGTSCVIQGTKYFSWLNQRHVGKSNDMFIFRLFATLLQEACS